MSTANTIAKNHLQSLKVSTINAISALAAEAERARKNGQPQLSLELSSERNIMSQKLAAIEELRRAANGETSLKNILKKLEGITDAARATSKKIQDATDTLKDVQAFINLLGKLGKLLG